MEIRLFVLAVYVFASCLADDTKSPNAPVITSAITKVARANEGEVTKKTPKPISNIDLNIATTTITTTTSSTTSKSNLNEGEKLTEKENVSSTENIWTALESFLATPSTVESSATSVASSFMKLLQSLDDVTPATNTEVEHNGRFARSVVAEEEENEEEDEDEDDSTPLTPSLEDALSRLANARDDKLISFETDTIPSPPTPPPISPAWARVPLYYQGAGLQLSREPSPPALVNPALTSVPSNTLDLSALLAMMLRSYPSSPSPLIPNLLFPSMSIVNRTSNFLPQPPQGPRNSVNSLFGKSYNPPKMAPDMKLDDKDGSSKELDPAESTQDKVSAKKPDDNDYEYEYVYYYYDEDDPNNKTMVVKPASAVKPKNGDQKLGLTAVPALLPRQPVGPSAAEGRSVEGGSADNALRDQDDRTLSPLLTPHFTTPSVVAKPPLPFVQGPQSPVMFLGIQRETYQGPRVPARTHPAKEPDDLYAFSRAFDDHTSQSVEPFTYKPNFESENEGRVFEPNSTDDDILLPPKSKTTTTKAPKKTTTTATTTTEKATTSGRGRRPGGGRKGRTSTAPPTTTTKGRRAPNRRGNNRKNKGKGKETTEKVEEDEEEVTTEKPARGGRKGGRPTRTRTTSKPRGGRRKTTTSSRNGKAKTTATVSAAANDEVTTVASAVTTAKRGLSNLFPRRKTLRPLTTTAAPSEEEGGNEEEEVQVSTTEKVISTTSGRKVRSTTTPTTTTVGELSEEGVEVEAEVEESNPVTSQAPKSPIQRLRPLRPLRVKTTVEPDNS